MAAGKSIANKVDVLIVVWDGKEAAGTEDTDDAITYAASHRLRVLHIDPVTREVATFRR